MSSALTASYTCRGWGKVRLGWVHTQVLGQLGQHSCTADPRPKQQPAPQHAGHSHSSSSSSGSRPSPRPPPRCSAPRRRSRHGQTSAAGQRAQVRERKAVQVGSREARLKADPHASACLTVVTHHPCTPFKHPATPESPAPTLGTRLEATAIWISAVPSITAGVLPAPTPRAGLPEE